MFVFQLNESKEKERQERENANKAKKQLTDLQQVSVQQCLITIFIKQLTQTGWFKLNLFSFFF